ncbi:MAG: HD domain-containing protein [Actinomycetales bacterium]|nr:HD domain-containing protein [Actinomycetales bacterium]
MTTSPQYSPRFLEALTFAASKHETQIRKKAVAEVERGEECVPYVSHLLGVAAIVFEAGGDEEAAIAGLLHDSVEDQDVTPAELAERFGPDVARIVDACSEHWDHSKPKPEWHVRKEAHLALLTAEADRSVVLVTAADKIHNGESIIHDLNAFGPVVWQRFNAGPDRLLWYYTEVTKVVRAVLGKESYASVRLSNVTRRLAQAVAELRMSTAADGTDAAPPVPMARA